MKRYIAYFLYILKHKYHVFVIGRKLGVSFFQLLLHDVSKFLPSEFFSYAKTYYNDKGISEYTPNDDIYIAWNAHQKRNKHHWQYYVLLDENHVILPLDIPDKYLNEMVADMLAFSIDNPKAKSALDYYNSSKERMFLSRKSTHHLEDLLEKMSKIK